MARGKANPKNRQPEKYGSIAPLRDDAERFRRLADECGLQQWALFRSLLAMAEQASDQQRAAAGIPAPPRRNTAGDLRGAREA